VTNTTNFDYTFDFDKKALQKLRVHLAYIKLALDAIWQNKLRSFLSVLGITIGIFCIIMVFTAVNSLERHVKQSVESFGTDVIFVQKWPWTFGSDYPWWNYVRRPTPEYKNFVALDKQLGSTVVEYGAYVTSLGNATIEEGSNYLEGINIIAATHQYNKVQDLTIQDGRYFSDFESQTGRNVVILGASVAEKLNLSAKDMGTTIRLNKMPVTVVGVLKKQGENLLGKNNDELVFTPYVFLTKQYNLTEGSDPSMMLKVKPGIPLEEAKAEVQGIMRSLLKLKIKDDDNFALNQISMLTQNLSVLFDSINIAGLMIGLFSVLVGGFGVANIMFVSVKERTNLIGIQKALGARQSFIQNQFLAESVLLCIIGGLLGIGLVYGICLLANWGISMSDNTFRLHLSIEIFVTGVLFSAFIGIVAGLFPASKAAKMLPVDAIRAKG